jgi:hypothetical protein
VSKPSAWDKLRAIFRQEKADLDEMVADATVHGNEVLDQKEREAAASPEEKLRLEQERAAAADAEYEALRKKIEGT